MKKKVIVGLSGGVDSSVAAYLLKEQGYEVLGLTIRTWDEPTPRTDKDCDNTSDFPPSTLPNTASTVLSDAAAVAGQLEIPHYVADLRKAFQENVIDYFTREYQVGRTPNPCVVCNRCIKWSTLMEQAHALGADYIATGHYARIIRLENGRYSVRNSITAAKDQTYALYGLSQAQLQHTLMPVGDYSKEEVRTIAEKLGISVSDKPDSMEICFIPDNDYAAYIKRTTGYDNLPGNFVDKDGNVLGRHKGIIHYTIGQRKGLGLALGHPVFVSAIRPDTNEVVIGENSDIFCNRLFASQLNFMAVEQLRQETRLRAKIRYSHSGAACTVKMLDADVLECIFDEPQRAITPGQALVLYQEDYVLGGGTIL